VKKSESIAALAKALASFQAEVNDPKKDSDNPFFKSKYVALNDLTAAVRPTLAKHGLSYMQFPTGDGAMVSMVTLLLHESGEWIESDPFAMKPVKADPQGMGSVMTYARRYSLQSVLGVAWEEDDDGNASSFPRNGAGKPQNGAGTSKQSQRDSYPADVKKGSENAELKDRAVKKVMAIQKENGISNEQVKAVISWKFGKESFTKLELHEACQLADQLLEYVKEMAA